MTALDASRAWWDEGAGNRFFKTASFGGYDETPEPNSRPTLSAFFCAQRTRFGTRQLECTQRRNYDYTCDRSRSIDRVDFLGRRSPLNEIPRLTKFWIRGEV